MPHPFPHRYSIEIRWNGRDPASLEAPPRTSLAAGSPPEFDGNAEWWSPEHLLLGALNLCLMLTYRALAPRAGVEVLSWESRVEATLDKTKEGLVYTEIVVRPTARVRTADLAKAQELFAKAKQFCIVSNALKPPIRLEGKAIAG